jgi:hypothetical protein
MEQRGFATGAEERVRWSLKMYNNVLGKWYEVLGNTILISGPFIIKGAISLYCIRYSPGVLI